MLSVNALLAQLNKGDDGECFRNNLKVHVQHLCIKLGNTGREPRYILNEGVWDIRSQPARVYTPISLEPAKPGMILAGFHLTADIAVGWYTLSTLVHTCGCETAQTI